MWFTKILPVKDWKRRKPGRETGPSKVLLWKVQWEKWMRDWLSKAWDWLMPAYRKVPDPTSILLCEKST